ncbi:MAG: hypothetical protein U1F76_23355 [Candidatus Competibacteraceae bacterium]
MRGDIGDSNREFEKAEKLQRENEGTRPWLLMDHGFYYRLLKLDVASTREELDHILKDAQGAGGPDQSWLAPLGLDQLVKGIVLSRMGDMSSAAALFKEAKETLRESGFVAYLPYYYNAKARFEIARNRLDDAMEDAAEAEDIASNYGMPLLKADAYLTAAEVYIARRSADDAAAAVTQATGLVTAHGYGLRRIDIDLLEGQVALLKGRWPDSSIRLLEQVGKAIDETGRNSLRERWKESLAAARERAVSYR